jgi:hypothetical protein
MNMTTSTSNTGHSSGIDPEYKEYSRKWAKHSHVGESKFDVYMANLNPVPDVNDPFAWWKANETRFSNLSCMVKDYLAVSRLDVRSKESSVCLGGSRRGNGIDYPPIAFPQL